MQGGTELLQSLHLTSGASLSVGLVNAVGDGLLRGAMWSALIFVGAWVFVLSRRRTRTAVGMTV